MTKNIAFQRHFTLWYPFPFTAHFTFLYPSFTLYFTVHILLCCFLTLYFSVFFDITYKWPPHIPDVKKQAIFQHCTFLYPSFTLHFTLLSDSSNFITLFFTLLYFTFYFKFYILVYEALFYFPTSSLFITAFWYPHFRTFALRNFWQDLHNGHCGNGQSKRPWKYWNTETLSLEESFNKALIICH